MVLGLPGVRWQRHVSNLKLAKRLTVEEVCNIVIDHVPFHIRGLEEECVQGKIMKKNRVIHTHALVSNRNTLGIWSSEYSSLIIITRYVLIQWLFSVFAVSVPSEFLWSEWSVPDILCDVGTQKRTTMCGSLRRRLPNIPGRDSDDPASRAFCAFLYTFFAIIK